MHDKDAVDILGVTADDQIIVDNADEDSISGLDQLVFGGQSKTTEKKRINDKQYQSVGVTPKTADKTE